MRWLAVWFIGGALLAGVGRTAVATATNFTVATYNLENYLLEGTGSRQAKPAAARARVREAIRRIHPDVLAVQEIGPVPALLELQASLRTDGLDYPHWEHVAGWDTNIFVGVLSRFPITARRPHTNENFLLQGRRFHVSRGFAEIDLQVNRRYVFTLVAAHLKSRRPVPAADEADLRFAEAARLRETIDEILRRRPGTHLLVVGDFNDTPDAPALRTIVGSGANALIDTRPAEPNGDPVRGVGARPVFHNITWTYHYARQDNYQRIDYLLVNAAMAADWRPAGSYVLSMPGWGEASDHRPVVAAFVTPGP